MGLQLRTTAWFDESRIEMTNCPGSLPNSIQQLLPPTALGGDVGLELVTPDNRGGMNLVVELVGGELKRLLSVGPQLRIAKVIGHDVNDIRLLRGKKRRHYG